MAKPRILLVEDDPLVDRYKNEPGAIPLWEENVAPNSGRRAIGHVPFGLSAIVAESMEGKTRLLSAWSAIPLDIKKPEELLTITRGEREGAIGFGTAELRVRLVGEDGKARIERSRSDAHGPIHDLPDPIEMAITGGDHISPESNWRHRLQALNRFAPVPVTEEALRILAGSLPAPDADIVDAMLQWHGGSPFPSLLEAADWLADGKRGILHARKRSAQGEAATLSGQIQSETGRLRELVGQVARAGGWESGDLQLHQLLRSQGPEADELNASLAEERRLENELGGLRVRLDDRREALVRRRRLQESLGERPTLEPAEQAIVEVAARLETAGAAFSAASQDLKGVEAAIGEADEEYRLTEVHQTRWKEDVEDLAVRLHAALGTEAWSDAAEVLRQLGKLNDQLSPAVREALAQKNRLVALEGERDMARLAFDAARQEHEGVERELKAAKAALAAAVDRQEAWDRTAAEVRAELPPITAGPLLQREERIVEALDELSEAATIGVYDEIAERVLGHARELLGQCSRLARVAEARPRHEVLQAGIQKLQDQLERVNERAELLEAEALRVWDRMAEVFSAGLRSEFVRVGKGRVIEVRLDDGTWVDVANDVEISKGRLRRAFLDFFLERTPAGERNVRVSDDVMLPIGRDGREELSRRAAAKQIRLLFEQPRLGDEPEGLHVVWYGGGAA